MVVIVCEGYTVTVYIVIIWDHISPKQSTQSDEEIKIIKYTNEELDWHLLRELDMFLSLIPGFTFALGSCLSIGSSLDLRRLRP